jgi:hypothetical protein
VKPAVAWVSTNLLISSIAATAVGIVLVLLAEFGGVHAVRFIGAGLVTTGGVGIGIDTGLADPRKLRVPPAVRRWRVALGLVALLLVVVPALIVLLGVVVGLYGDAHHNRSAVLATFGGIIGGLLFLAVITTSVISARSMVRAGTESTTERSDAQVGPGDEEAGR